MKSRRIAKIFTLKRNYCRYVVRIVEERCYNRPDTVQAVAKQQLIINLHNSFEEIFDPPCPGLRTGHVCEIAHSKFLRMMT